MRWVENLKFQIVISYDSYGPQNFFLTSLDISDVDPVWTWGGQTSPPQKNRKNS